MILLEKRRVLARQGWVGEKSGLLSTLCHSTLGPEEDLLRSLSVAKNHIMALGRASLVWWRTPPTGLIFLTIWVSLRATQLGNNVCHLA